MILQSTTFKGLKTSPFARQTQNENQPGEVGQSDLPANSPPQQSHFSRIGCLLRYCELNEQGERPDPFLGESSFLVYSALKIQNESCDPKERNRCGGV